MVNLINQSHSEESNHTSALVSSWISDSVLEDSVLDCSSAMKSLSSALEADSTSSALEELPEPIAGLCFLNDFLLAWSLSPEGPLSGCKSKGMHVFGVF